MASKRFWAAAQVGVGLTFGLVVLAMIYALGDISGAHLNPAVTLGFWMARRFESLWIYLGAPVVGTLLAVFACRCVREEGCCAAAQAAPAR